MTARSDREVPAHDEIVQAGDPVLRAVAGTVGAEQLAADDIQRLIDRMIEVLHTERGVGLAAPQVGAPFRIAVVEDLAEFHQRVPEDVLRAQGRVPIDLHVLVNPELTVLDDDPAEFFEGCLSVSGYRAIVPRPRAVAVRAVDRRGTPFAREAHGWYARILQHEVDHLDGILYVDRMYPRSLVSEAHYEQTWKDLPIERARRRLVNPGT